MPNPGLDNPVMMRQAGALLGENVTVERKADSSLNGRLIGVSVGGIDLSVGGSTIPLTWAQIISISNSDPDATATKAKEARSSDKP